MPQSEGREKERNDASGLIAGIAAFVTWGLIPGFWKLLKSVPAQEILAHRYVWTAVFLTLLLTWQQRWKEIAANARSRRAVLYCLASGSNISINWFLFIWAVNAGHVLETSMGYFMTPLVNVLFGAIFLHERLNRWQIVSVALATCGVLNLTFGFGRFPWVALALCVSFACYGLLRKKGGTAAMPGLFFETVLLIPVALGYLIWLRSQGNLVFGGGLHVTLLLISTGVVTGLPLMWFGHAARHLRLTTLGFLQYLSPTGSFCLGVFVYHETFTRGHLITFGLIWIALVVFTLDAVTSWRRMTRAQAAPIPLARPV